MLIVNNKKDMQKQGLRQEQVVDLIGEYKGETRRANKFKVIDI